MNFEDAWQILKPSMLRRANKMYRVVAFSPVADRDDLVSLAMLAVWEACQATDEPENIRRFAHRRFAHFVWRLAFDVSPLYYPTSTTHFKNAVGAKCDSLDSLMEVAGDFLPAPTAHDFADVEVDAILQQTAKGQEEYEIARLHILEGYRLVEVASMMNLPVAKVRRLWENFVRRARQRW